MVHAQVANIEGGVLVFGNEKNLREIARKFTLKQRIADDPIGEPDWFEHITLYT